MFFEFHWVNPKAFGGVNATGLLQMACLFHAPHIGSLFENGVTNDKQPARLVIQAGLPRLVIASPGSKKLSNISMKALLDNPANSAACPNDNFPFSNKRDASNILASLSLKSTVSGIFNCIVFIFNLFSKTEQ